MQLQHIELDRLSISGANMRASKKAPNVSDILPSVRSRGILVPLLVRPNGEPDHFEIVAGRRRYFAASTVAAEQQDFPALPCAVLDAGDDAAAVEASLIENVMRLAPDEVTQWATFTRLVKEGRSVEEIAATFTMAELRVRRILALGNLLPRIRNLYRQEKIDVATIRHLTLASPEQQRDWLRLFDSPDAFAPRAHQLKQWLFGGTAIPTKAALFPLEAYTGAVVVDLFGEDSYFADMEQFWTLQHAVIEERRQSYLAAGWSAVETLSPVTRFESWNHVRTSKSKGGRVYLEVSARGEVTVHEGYLPEKEVRKRQKADEPKAPRSGMTAPLRNYIELHQHAAVRAKLLDHPQVALRLMVAHAICGSHLWMVRADPRTAAKEATAASVAGSGSEKAFSAARTAVLEKLGFAVEEPDVVGSARGGALVEVFQKLLHLPDAEVLSVLTVVMGETLAVGGEIVSSVGTHLQLDIAGVWQAEDAFFDLVRDRQMLVEMVAEVAGASVAKANEGEKGKVLKGIILDCLAGTGDRAKKEGWVPSVIKMD